MKRKASGGTRMNTRHALWRKITASFSLVLVLSLVFASPALADINLRVQVIDYCSRQPIQDALVEVPTSRADLGAETEGTTGADGWANIDPVRPGDVEHTVRVTKQGYEPDEITREMEADTTQELVVELTPVGGCPPLPEPPPCQLDKIIVDPPEVDMQVGEQQLFWCAGQAADGDDCQITHPLLTATGGTLDPQGSSATYTATTPGDFTITCTESGTTIQGTANIHTTAPPCQLDKIIIDPSEVEMKVGDKQLFTATGLDLDGNPCQIIDAYWIASGGATLDPACQGSTSCPYTATEPGDHWLECREGDTDIFGRTEFDVMAAGVGGLPCPVGLAPLAGIGIAGLVFWRRRPAGKR